MARQRQENQVERGRYRQHRKCVFVVSVDCEHARHREGAQHRAKLVAGFMNAERPAVPANVLRRV